MYFSEVTFKYESCASDCLTCTNSLVCATCSANIDFRVLNQETKRCDPLPGYTNDGNSSKAKKCAASSCISCFIS